MTPDTSMSDEKEDILSYVVKKDSFLDDFSLYWDFLFNEKQQYDCVVASKIEKSSLDCISPTPGSPCTSHGTCDSSTCSCGTTFEKGFIDFGLFASPSTAELSIFYP